MEIFKNISMLSLPPVLPNFPSVGIHTSVDINAIFTFEPMHSLSLVISKLLNECTFSLLKDEKRYSSAMSTKSNAIRSFFSIRNTVLRSLKLFLSEVEVIAVGFGVHVNFGKAVVNGRLSELFAETGLMEMLEASDFEAVDIVSPLLGAIVYRFCGLVEEVYVTTVFKKYEYLTSFLFRKKRIHGGVTKIFMLSKIDLKL